MTQTPVHDATHPPDRPDRDSTPSPSADPNLGAGPPATAVIADAEIVRANVLRTRLCVLCGRPLRAGQHMLRVHGSTIHARCTSTGR